MVSRFMTPSSKSFPFWQSLLWAILLLAAVFLAYRPVWHAKFLWDDDFLVIRNPFIRSPILLLECFQHFLFSESVMHFYRPVQNWSYFFDYWRGGLDPAIYHQTNLLIHGLNAVFLFILARRWWPSRSCLGPLGIALLWALHPAFSATAAYISGRADSLALLFVLAGWWSWENALEATSRTRRSLFFALAFLSALLAMCSKEIAAEALLLFLLHLWIIRRELPQKIRLFSSVGSLFLFGCYGILRQLPTAAGASDPARGLPFLERLHLFLRAMGDYFRLLVWPERLYMERQIVDQPGLLQHPASFDPLFPYLGWIGGIFLVLLLTAVLWRGEGQRLRRFGALWFIVMILPVSNLFALNASVAEHWLYFPSIGFLLCLAGCWRGRGLVPGVLIVVAIGALGARTWLRAMDWTDAFTFYRATVRDGGDSVRIRVNLAAEYQKRHQLPEAERLYRSVLQRMPTYVFVQRILADNLRAQGRGPEADAILHSIPAQVGNEKNLRTLYAEQPDSWPAAHSFAEALLRQDQPAAAILVVQSFAQRHWWHAESHQFLGDLLAGNGQPAAALAAWQQVTRLDIRAEKRVIPLR